MYTWSLLPPVPLLRQGRTKFVIGIAHVFFHAVTFADARGSCLNMRSTGRGFKLLPRDMANTNALK